MTNKKLLQIVAIIAVAAALFTTIMAVGMQKIQKQRAEATTEAPSPPQRRRPPRRRG